MEAKTFTVRPGWQGEAIIPVDEPQTKFGLNWIELEDWMQAEGGAIGNQVIVKPRDPYFAEVWMTNELGMILHAYLPIDRGIRPPL